ncbi:MAG: DUF433 domain-containing protein [Microthrixaceae bacterium]
MSAGLDAPSVGEGIYTFPEAARIIRNAVDPISPETLRSWVNTGLVPADRYDPDLGEEVLTFEDLVSLEVIRRLRRDTPHPATLQQIRRVEKVLRTRYDYHRPFARRIFYTDGAKVWAEVLEADGTKGMIELRGKGDHAYYVWSDAIGTFADRIDWEGDRALVWRPTAWVEINPRIQFGAPVVTGSRVPVSTVAAQLEAGTPEEVARWYDLDVRAVRGVSEYLALGA